TLVPPAAFSPAPTTAIACRAIVTSPGSVGSATSVENAGASPCDVKVDTLRAHSLTSGGRSFTMLRQEVAMSENFSLSFTVWSVGEYSFDAGYTDIKLGRGMSTSIQFADTLTLGQPAVATLDAGDFSFLADGVVDFGAVWWHPQTQQRFGAVIHYPTQ